MGEIIKQIDAPPGAEKIQNIENEVLPCGAQAQLAPEMISGQHAAANKETDSDFRPLTETNQIGVSTASRKLVIRKIWSWAMLALALAFTAVWICLLGYGLVKLIEMAI